MLTILQSLLSFLSTSRPGSYNEPSRRTKPRSSLLVWVLVVMSAYSLYKWVDITEAYRDCRAHCQTKVLESQP